MAKTRPAAPTPRSSTTQPHRALHRFTAHATLAAFLAGYAPLASLAPELTPIAPIAPAQALAADVTAIAPGFNGSIPPQYDMARIAHGGMLFQDCNGGLQNSIQQGIQQLGQLATQGPKSMNNPAAALGFGVDAVCPGSSTGPNAESLTCENLAPTGVLDKATLDQKARAIDAAFANIQCQKGKFQAVKGELQCLTNQADMLTQQLSTIQSMYQANIQRMQQDVAQIDSYISDREAQREDVLGKLGGSKDNGSKGLLGVRDKIQEAITAMNNQGIPGSIRELENEMEAVKNLRKKLADDTIERTSQLAGQCFEGGNEGKNYRCTVGGELVSAKEYLLCIYEDSIARGTKKGLTQEQLKANMNDGVLAAKAAEKKAELAALLGEISSQVPKAQAAPKEGEAAAPTGLAPTVLTAADVQAQYGDRLESFGTITNRQGNEVSIHAWVMDRMSRCYQKAQNSVKKEQKLVTSGLGATKLSLDTREGDLKVKGNTLIQAHSLQWSEAMTALTGLNLPLNTASCKNGAPNVQINCLKDLQHNMEGLLQGNVKQSAVKMVIKSNDPRTQIAFSCQGLNGCIAALQNVDRNIQTDQKRVQTFKKDYVMRSAQSTENFTKQMAAMMSAQGAALNNRLKRLNSALASMGVPGGVNIDPVEAEAQEFDDNGLPKTPKSAVNLIGGLMNPPMLNVSGNNFSEALANIGEGMEKLDEKSAPLQEARGKLAALTVQCGSKAVKDQFDLAQSTLDKLESGNCEWSDEFCSPESQSVLTALSGSLNELLQPGYGLRASDIANIDARLTNGMEGCEETAADRAALQDSSGLTEAKRESLKMRKKKASNSCRSISRNIARDIANVGNANAAGGGNSGSAQ